MKHLPRYDSFFCSLLGKKLSNLKMTMGSQQRISQEDEWSIPIAILCTISILVLVAILLLAHWLAGAAWAPLMSRVARSVWHMVLVEPSHLNHQVLWAPKHQHSIDPYQDTFKNLILLFWAFVCCFLSSISCTRFPHLCGLITCACWKDAAVSFEKNGPCSWCGCALQMAGIWAGSFITFGFCNWSI